MYPEFDLFISLSAIAGIFIGFGAYPNLHPAFYTTAIILNLVQGGILLVQIVYAAKSESINDNT